MPSTFAIVHTKGGVGKTTSAVFLAVAAHRAGLSVELLDTDPQKSATEWAGDATAADDPFPFPVRPATHRELNSTPSVDLRVVDTPPGTASVIGPAINNADLVVIPTGVSPLDVRRVWPTLEITAHRPTVVLLTSVMLNTRLATEVREVLEDEGVGVANTPILRREALRKTYGTVPIDMFGYDAALKEIQGVLE